MMSTRRHGKQRLTELMSVIEGAGGAFTHALDTLALMEVAEHVIAEEKAKWRRGKIHNRIHSAFAILCPPPGFVGKAEALYRYHARELVERVAKGDDTRPGTKAEVLLALSQTSLVAPLHATPCALMERLFKECFPEATHVWGAYSHALGVAYELYPGAADELLEQARNKAYNAERVLR